MEMPVLKIGLQARNGWTSDIPTFVETPKTTILAALIAFLPDASPEQVQAWEQSTALLQEALGAATRSLPSIAVGFIILEYELPMEARRPDVVLLLPGCTVAVEFKGKAAPRDADIGTRPTRRTRRRRWGQSACARSGRSLRMRWLVHWALRRPNTLLGKRQPRPIGGLGSRSCSGAGFGFEYLVEVRAEFAGDNCAADPDL
jgi:hypothetical protein